MNELNENEREVLDSLNEFNLKNCGIKNDSQSLWNICWGYLNNKFNIHLIDEPNASIIEVLRKLNKEAPKITTQGDIDANIDEMYTTVAMNPLF